MKTEPDYYAQNGLSPIGAMKQGLTSQEELIGFYKGNIIKYVVRAGKKGNAVKDLLKARNYINFYLDLFTMTPEEMEEFHQGYKTPINKNDVAADKSELLKNERCILEPVSKDVEIKLPEHDLVINGTIENVELSERLERLRDLCEDIGCNIDPTLPPINAYELLVKALGELNKLGYTIEDGEVVKLQEEEDENNDG